MSGMLTCGYDFREHTAKAVRFVSHWSTPFPSHRCVLGSMLLGM